MLETIHTGKPCSGAEIKNIYSAFFQPVRLGWLFSCILNELMILKMFGY